MGPNGGAEDAAQSLVLDALFFAASFQGTAYFVTQDELIRETGLSADELTACVQALIAKGFIRDDGRGGVQITKTGLASLRG